MNSNFAAHVPINSTSLGQSAQNILMEWYKQGLQPCIFPISNVDLTAFDYVTEDYKNWLKSNIKKANKQYKRNWGIFKLWHLVNSIESYGLKQILLTFVETNKLTETEVNISNNNHKILVTSNYTKNVFNSSGIENVEKVCLGFDENSFGRPNNKKYHDDNVIFWGLTGKLEMRKAHLEILSIWAAQFGNSREHFLNCAIFNPFLSPEQQGQIISQTLKQKYWNINFNPFMGTNSSYFDFLSSNDIVIGMSKSECFDLPVMQSLCLGKHIVGLRGHAYLEYLNDSNSILVEPKGEIPAYDGMFFRESEDFNQGNFLNWERADFEVGLKQIVQRYKQNKINTPGFEVRKQFTWEKTANKILKSLEEIS